ncbi:MAG: sensor histidine kinase [Solirubrobacteraceae bacterium]
MLRPLGLLLSAAPPYKRVGALVAVAAVALCTLIVFPLKHVAPVVSLSVVYLPAVLIVSASWGGWLGAATAVLSAAAFNFFQLPPTGRFTIRNPDNWVALAAFLLVAWLVSSIAEVTRARAREAGERRREADLAAEMAGLLLSGNPLSIDLPTAAARLTQALGLASAAIELGAVEGDERRLAFPLREGTRRIGTVLVPADTPEARLRRLQERVVPALEALLSAALEREALVGDVVETAALRRADVVKTALLRSVSHDLRSPLTAIAAASEALDARSLSEEERVEMAAVIRLETRRLSRLVDNLLDLSRLEAGVAQPRVELTSLEDLIRAALRDVAGNLGDFDLAIARDLPLVSLDPVQMERAFVNVLENARRHSGGHPVSVRARAVSTLSGDGGRERIIVRIVDRGPGIPRAQLERVFEPFYRARPLEGAQRGSGLGLAIARGFTEGNGGTLHAESLPGQGTSFVFELPLQGATREGDAPAEGAATAPATATARAATEPPAVERLG